MKLDIIKAFKDKKVLLVGDAILDVYIYGNIVGQALDAPVPEMEETRTQIFFGGNGLVASHILELGGKVTFITVLGTDEEAKHYESFVHPKLQKLFLTDPARKTTVKRRWYANGGKLLQVNSVDNHALSSALENKIIKRLALHMRMADAVVIMDPHHGILTKKLIDYLKKVSRKFDKPIYVDSQFSYRKNNYSHHAGVDCMILNEREAKAAYPGFDLKKPERSLRAARKKLRLTNIVVKLGSRGSIAIFNGRYIRSGPHQAKAIDVCGAGDAFLAAFCLGDRSRPEESLEVANIWAALSTEIHGTIPPRKRDLFKVLKIKGHK